MEIDRQRQLRKWRSRRPKIEKSAALKHLLGVYSNASDFILNRDNLDLNGFRRYAREIMAYDFRQNLLEGSNIRTYHEKITGRQADCANEIEKYQEQLSALQGASSIGMIAKIDKKSGKIVAERIDLEVIKQKIISAIEITRAQRDVYGAFFKLYDEVMEAAGKEVRIQRKGEFKSLAKDNLKALEDKVKPRKSSLPADVDKLARFAFLLQQWEKAYEMFNKKEEGYSEVVLGEKNAILRPSEFFQKQWDELNPLFLQVVGIDNIPEKLAEAVGKEYITERQAHQASSYLELAVKCQDKGRIRGREVLRLSLPKDAEESPKARLSGEEVRMFIPGMSGDLADAVAKHLKEDTLLERHSKLSSILSEDISQRILASNPELLVEDESSFDGYIHLMEQYISGEKSPERALERVESDLERFNNAKWLRRIVGAMYADEPAAALAPERANEYETGFREIGFDMALVGAMVSNGMKLNKKYFGKCYIPGVHVFRNLRSFFKKNPKLAGEFDRTFDWLIDQGVIIHHYGKGKAKDQGTVSLNSHISEIKTPILREYVADIFTRHGILHRNG